MSPTGLPLLPGLCEPSDQLLLLGVDADHRVAAVQVLLGAGVDVAELGVAVGVLGAFEGLAGALQAVPGRAQDRRHRGVAEGGPIAVSSRASVRVDFVVHRSGDSGSPRVSGSMSESKFSSSSGSATSAFFRPPPGLRTR